MIHKFIKEADGIWYIDLPEYIEQGLGSKANLMMVAGADTFLDVLSNNSDEVTLEIDTQPFHGYEHALVHIHRGMDEELLKIAGHPDVEYGGYYIAFPLNHLLWLCPVTEYVFGGDYPKNIYTRVLSSN
jgi:hypothetical protein